MKKIGIATPFRVPNYGTKLQAYAILTYLKENSGAEVEILNYTPSSDRRIKTIFRKMFSIKRNIARVNRIISRKNAIKIVQNSQLEARKKAINGFDNVLKISEAITSYSELVNKSKDYDCIVCGSDQIWVPDNIQDNYYTLDFCDKNTKKGAYAASLGVEVLNNSQQKAYRRFLKELDFISIREEIGRDLIYNIYNEKNVSWVCDPTFLLSKEHWKQLEKRPHFLSEHTKKYVFCYFLGTDEMPRKVVYDYAKEKGATILSIANFKGYCEADNAMTDIQLYDLSVNEFLYLIDNAEMVCTDSMHATIFSIIFESEFVTFERFKRTNRDSRNSRIYSLLKVMGLEARLVSGEKINDEKIDYSKVEIYKEEHIKLSQSFINEEILECL